MLSARDKQEFRSRTVSDRWVVCELPPYIVGHDRSLTDVVRLLPRTRGKLELAHSMGVSCVARYGAALLGALQQA